MTELDLVLPKRHDAQARVVTEAARFNVLACGRRWGKTTLGVDLLITEPGGLLDGLPCAWFAPDSKDFDEVWHEAKRLLAPITTRVDSQKNRIEVLTGAALDFWTLHNTDNPGRGRKYARAVVDEAAIVPQHRLFKQWTEAIRPTLTDYAGGAWFLSTPKGQGFFKDLYDRGQDPRETEWASWQMPTSTNPHIDPREIEAARLELPSAAFRQEYLAEFIHEFGAVFKPPTYYDPSELPKQGYREATGCDFAYTSKSGDWTVFLTGRESNGILYITDMYREQAEATAWALELRSRPNPAAFIGGQESGIAAFLRKDYGIKLKTERASTDKRARAMPAATAWNRGEIRLPARSALAREIEAEVLAFTGDPKIDAHDDVVDALAALHRELLRPGKTSLEKLKRAQGY